MSNHDRPAPLHVILGGVPCEDDGPTRDEDDNSVKWHDIYTEDELVKALNYHAAQSDTRGATAIGDELRCAAECIADLAEIRDKLITQVAEMAGTGMEITEGIERVRESLRASIESLSKPVV